MIDTDKYEGHTEGKWTLEKVEQTDAEHEHYLLIGNNLLLSAIHHGGQEWDEHEANARLIADAPLLLQEVKRLREQPKVTIDDWDKKGPCVTVYLEGCEYVGTLRLYKDENGKVIE